MYVETLEFRKGRGKDRKKRRKRRKQINAIKKKIAKFPTRGLGYQSKIKVVGDTLGGAVKGATFSFDKVKKVPVSRRSKYKATKLGGEAGAIAGYTKRVSQEQLKRAKNSRVYL